LLGRALNLAKRQELTNSGGFVKILKIKMKNKDPLDYYYIDCYYYYD